MPDHEARPDDMPEPGDRCKTCGQKITWVGPSTTSDWMHVTDVAVSSLPVTCDHCGQTVKPDINGWLVGEDYTSDCPVSDRGHLVDGLARL